ncbi:MAG: shikimate dehydrogenase [Saezia sp.]
MGLKRFQCTVIGNPIHHSLSPYIQAIFAEMAGVGMDYTRTLAPLEGFNVCVSDLVLAGLKGANVTRPFKFEALQVSTHATARAKLAGAANTLRFDVTPEAPDQEKIWWADNTDGVGLVRDITRNAGVALEGKSVLLIGAGGAASGVFSSLLEAKPKVLMVANRTPERAVQLVQEHVDLATQYGVELLAGGLSDCAHEFDVVINSSASSQDGYAAPVSAQVLKTGALALDMSYGQAAHPFLLWASEHDAVGRDGLGMLVEQGAEAFFFWHGVLPQGCSVLERVREYLQNR